MWRVVRNSNPRLPSIQVSQVILNRPAPMDATVIWEGAANSRPEAWESAGMHDPSLKGLPLPNPFDSGSVFARVRPKRQLETKRERRGRTKPNKVPAPHNGRDGGPSQKTRVLALYQERGTEGATDDEIEAALGLKHQSASARRNDLVHEGLIVNSGRTRKTTSGDEATVWITRPPNTKRPSWSDEAVRDAVSCSSSMTEALHYLEYKGAVWGAVYDWLREPIERLRLSTQHWSTPMKKKSAGGRKTKKDEIIDLIKGFFRQCGDYGVTVEEAADYVTKRGNFIRGSVESRFSEMKTWQQIHHPPGLVRQTKTGRVTDVYLLGKTQVSGGGDPIVASIELLEWTSKHKSLRSDPRLSAVFTAILSAAEQQAKSIKEEVGATVGVARETV